ncbi:MAG: hypothetical protein IID18_09180 [Nitrospinae bacterium]|nr:hypothetical protein [Nitrospinota bacterium]
MEILLADNRPGITSLISTLETDTRKISASIDSTSVKFDEALTQSNFILTENRRNLLELTQNMKETSRNLKSLSDDLRRNPWKLIRKSDEQPPDLEKPGTPASAAMQLRMKRLDKVPNP